ncbi:MAG: KilA-N domain-containing protein [Opitutaceae bacterium]|jgi:hypothetical protein|nr:KilA-N domain-containing protein [Opitutaceae bacterium]
MSSVTLVTETWQGAAITFRGGDAWVNATSMAKPFGKFPADFIRLAATKAFITALQADDPTMGNPIVSTEGRFGGTWMHPDLALEFARWLSPEFAIWTNRVIRRLMAGEPVAPSSPSVSSASPDMMAALTSLASTLASVVTLVNSLAERVTLIERRLPPPRGWALLPNRSLVGQGGRPPKYDDREVLALFPVGEENREALPVIRARALQVLLMPASSFSDYRYNLMTYGLVNVHSLDGGYYRPSTSEGVKGGAL